MRAQHPRCQRIQDYEKENISHSSLRNRAGQALSGLIFRLAFNEKIPWRPEQSHKKHCMQIRKDSSIAFQAKVLEKEQR